MSNFDYIKIEGICPACGTTCLFVNHEGRLECLQYGCPAPSTAHHILNQDNLECHEVTLTNEGWSTLHPLIERVVGLNFCSFEVYMRGLLKPPAAPGKYLAKPSLVAGFIFVPVQTPV